MTDLVLVSLEPWDDVWRRNQHLVAGLLGDDPALRVLFVEPAAYPLGDVLRRTRPHRPKGLRPGPDLPGLPGATGRLWLHQPAKPLPRRLDRGYDRRWAASVERAARRAGLHDPVLWVNDPAGAHVVTRTGWPSLYDITDDWLLARRTSAEHARLARDEALLLERCAEVVVCSPGLAAAKGRIRPVTLVPNAVDVAACRTPRPRPADLPEGPVAVYVGTVHTDRVDLDLCVSTARGLGSRGRLVLVGPAPLPTDARQRLIEAGVMLTGPRRREEVPGYLQHADLLVVPHVVDAFTDSLDPIKLYEYAAVARPVVSTPVAGFRDSDDPRVTVASGEEFVAAVLQRMPAAERFPHGVDERAVPTWHDRVVAMRAVVDRVSRAGQETGPGTRSGA